MPKWEGRVEVIGRGQVETNEVEEIQLASDGRDELPSCSDCGSDEGEEAEEAHISQVGLGVELRAVGSCRTGGWFLASLYR